MDTHECKPDFTLAAYINDLIAKGELWRFYKSKDWITLKQQVLAEDHHECQLCRARGKVTRFDEGKDGTLRLLSTVHHVNEVRMHPELALSLFCFDVGGSCRRNLISVCKECHNKIHNRTFDGAKFRREHFTNRERW